MNERNLGPWIALGAMGLFLFAALWNRPATVGAAAATTVTEDDWARAIEQGADHITPVELAERLLDDPASVLVIDVRPQEEFLAFHLPGAQNLSVPELLGERGRELTAAHPNAILVLCSRGMTHPAQAWVALATRGGRAVRVLEDGLDGFVRDVLTPPSLRESALAGRGVDFQRARAAFLPQRATIPAPAGATPAGANPAGASQAAAKPALERARLATDPARLETPTVVSTAWVAARGASIVLLDAREKPEDFAAGHLPGALHVPVKAWREERDGVPDELVGPDKLAEALGRLGIDADTEIAAYGDDRLQDPAQLVLALVGVGHGRVAIVEGGLAAWKADGRPLETEARTPTPKVYAPRAPASTGGVRLARLADVVAAREDGRTKLVDVRPADAFRGEVSTEARAGHIPGSTNRPYTSDVAKSADGLYWRPLDALKREYAALGVEPGAPVIVSCRTGHQAALTWFTLRYLLGYSDVRWYDGSWKEWSAHAELPAATGAGS